MLVYYSAALDMINTLFSSSSKAVKEASIIDMLILEVVVVVEC